MAKSDSQDKLNGGESIAEQSLDDSMNRSAMKAKNEEDQETSLSVQNWTGSKDQSLKNVMDYLESIKNKKKVALSEEFLTNTTVLLKNCLEENNLNLYMQAIEVAAAFFQRALHSE